MSQNTSSPSPAPGQGFFDWLRRLGISRGDSWIGGVCGGVAARLGIDPIIVRGIAVVVALLGGPAFLLYALAWLLLPDTNGSIHLENLVRGVFETAAVGVAVFALLAFLPLAQGVWWAAGWPFGVSADWSVTAGKVVWSAVVIAAIVALIVWLSRRAGGWGAPGSGPRWGGPGSGAETPGWQAGAGAAGAPDPAGSAASASAPTFDGSQTSGPQASGTPGVGAGTAAFAAGTATGLGGATSPPVAPSAPLKGDSPAAVADWRAKQAEWRQRYDSWKRDEAERARSRRASWSADAAARQAEALEQARLRRLANPRTSGPFVAITLGVALIVGALAAVWVNTDAGSGTWSSAFGFGAATAVVGLAMVVAGVSRRRSGFLAFVAIVLTVVTAALLAGAANYAALSSAVSWLL